MRDSFVAELEQHWQTTEITVFTNPDIPRFFIRGVKGRTAFWVARGPGHPIESSVIRADTLEGPIVVVEDEELYEFYVDHALVSLSERPEALELHLALWPEQNYFSLVGLVPS